MSTVKLKAAVRDFLARVIGDRPRLHSELQAGLDQILEEHLEGVPALPGTVELVESSGLVFLDAGERVVAAYFAPPEDSSSHYGTHYVITDEGRVFYNHQPQYNGWGLLGGEIPLRQGVSEE